MDPIRKLSTHFNCRQAAVQCSAVASEKDVGGCYAYMHLLFSQSFVNVHLKTAH